MRVFSLIYFSIFCFCIANAQLDFNKIELNQTSDDINTNNQYLSLTSFSNANKNKERFWVINLSVGSWQPIGTMAKIFSSGPFISSQVGLGNNTRFHIDLSFDFIFFNYDSKNIGYIRNDTLYKVKSTGIITYGLRFTKIYSLKNNFYFDCIFGFETIDIYTNLPTKNDNSTDEIIKTGDLYFGAAIRKSVFTKRSIGLSSVYHLNVSRYDSNVKTYLGSQYITIGLIYTF